MMRRRIRIRIRYYIPRILIAITGYIILSRFTNLHQKVMEQYEIDEKLQRLSGTESLPSIHYTTQESIDSKVEKREEDKDCPFYNSKLYRSIYVYEHPNLGPTSMLANNNNDNNSNNTSTTTPPQFEEWPWISIQEESMKGEWGHYAMGSQMDQYTLEIIIHTILTHPDSCLRTYDPETAQLFHVPFLNSVHFHNGKLFAQDYDTTPYAQALIDIMDEKYDTWEEVWGLTSKYWKRKKGADHISVMTEPLHGFWHPRSRRGNFHYINSQYQLKPHIVISMEVSTTFVNMYPECAKKNIVVPYPNPDGRFYNGVYDLETQKTLQNEFQIHNNPYLSTTTASPNTTNIMEEPNKKNDILSTYLQNGAPHPSEITPTLQIGSRPFTMYYSGGNHGTCPNLRKAIAKDYKCSKSGIILGGGGGGSGSGSQKSFQQGMRMSTFCPCPGGDSPSAKRMYDSVIAGCIPVILSHDFVWAFSTEYDDDDNDDISNLDDDKENEMIETSSSHARRWSSSTMNPSDFSIRLNANDFLESFTNEETCEILPNSGIPLHDYLEQSISSNEIQRLRSNLQQAKDSYSFYEESPDLPINTLKENILPTGGATFALLEALEERAGGKRWPACEAEMASVPSNREEPKQFIC